ncbi:prohibitin family protein [Wenyingzhuangia sp. 2_MG-2023]|uniref:prohibitin family protein n=1 Tax=Wenyingzhuangia sp. 2_MG-2023 TaxID=3062639 RepID=UPI0026E1E631|nr:prohibitin family protein [Wenyingzhuangia sp. 2_MG-2023]MDO6737520.1 prohibitin family protein [Wenyingzhuangia sp. 2_MG-2023]MDO6802823.1 prohibitin family protein [Wenyingzhuangia sp. 1_MG-2023]
MSTQKFNFPKGLPVIIILVVVGIIFVSKTALTIDAGKAGVLFKTFGGGVETEKPALGEGFHIIAPWNKVYEYDVRQQELFEKMKVLSSNGLDILLEVTAWYKPQTDKLGLLYQKKGQNYLETVIKPSLRSAARSVVGRYTPEQIYSSKRDVIQSEIFDETKKLLESQYIQLNNVLVRDVTLPPTIKTAIENKLKQEQEFLEYEFTIQKAQKEAERQRIDAEGKAAANRILNESLSDKILKEKGIQATVELAKSPNSKVIVIGSGKEGLPLILGNQ